MKTSALFSMNSQVLFLLIFCLLLGFTNSTNVIAQDKLSSRNTTTVVFIDKTTSIETDSFIIEKNQSWLRRILKQNIIVTGDQIILSYIYQNTASSSNKTVFTYRPPKERTGRMSSSEARMAKIKHKKRLRAYQNSFIDRIIANAFSSQPSLSGTNVIGSFKILSDISIANPKHQLKAVYISDMQECSSFRKLFCESSHNSIKSFNHALTLAKKDYPRIIQKYQLNKNCLQEYNEIIVVFPARELDTDPAFAILPTYWSYLFSQCGVNKINYH
jgi:hypothetical protein